MITSWSCPTCEAHTLWSVAILENFTKPILATLVRTLNIFFMRAVFTTEAHETFAEPIRTTVALTTTVILAFRFLDRTEVIQVVGTRTTREFFEAFANIVLDALASS